MSIQVLGYDGNAFDQNSVEAVGGRFIRTVVRAVLSGNYVTGGDTLDLTNAGGTALAPTTVPTGQSRGIAQIDPRPISKSSSALYAVGGSYAIIAPGGVVPIPNSAVNALKMKLFLVTNAEYTAGAYGADALGDIILFEIMWAR